MTAATFSHGWAAVVRRGARVVAAAAVLVALCSCRSPMPVDGGAQVVVHDGPESDQGQESDHGPDALSQGPPSQQSAAGMLPGHAWTGAPGDGATIPAGAAPHNPFAALGMPLPQMLLAPWRPAGIAGPWPHDEYLLDGGDRDAQVTVGPDFQVRGLEMEDTIAHYDTIDGRVVVKPSNRVCIYSPRFGAVRKVTSVEQSDQYEQVVESEAPLKPVHYQENLPATTAIQPLQPRGEIGTKQVSIERLRQHAQPAVTRIAPGGVENELKAYEDFAVIRHGVLEGEEKARLAVSVDAAITWSHDQGAQVILDRLAAVEVTGDQRAQATFRVDVPNNPCLRVIKVASTNMAKPGEIIDFTIRFDNIGDQVIGNVTLIDNLTTRLEYVPDSAKSSLAADFSTDRNEGDSLVLRWEFADPLPAGQGGVVRFHCRVR